jgi:hypothetical protein
MSDPRKPYDDLRESVQAGFSKRLTMQAEVTEIKKLTPQVLIDMISNPDKAKILDVKFVKEYFPKGLEVDVNKIGKETKDTLHYCVAAFISPDITQFQDLNQNITKCIELVTWENCSNPVAVLDSMTPFAKSLHATLSASKSNWKHNAFYYLPDLDQAPYYVNFSGLELFKMTGLENKNLAYVNFSNAKGCLFGIKSGTSKISLNDRIICSQGITKENIDAWYKPVVTIWNVDLKGSKMEIPFFDRFNLNEKHTFINNEVIAVLWVGYQHLLDAKKTLQAEIILELIKEIGKDVKKSFLDIATEWENKKYPKYVNITYKDILSLPNGVPPTTASVSTRGTLFNPNDDTQGQPSEALSFYHKVFHHVESAYISFELENQQEKPGCPIS